MWNVAGWKTLPKLNLIRPPAACLVGLLCSSAVITTVRAQTPASEFRDCDTCAEMVVIPAGTFEMGGDPFSLSTQPNELPQHLVTLRSFAVGKYEVTQEEWVAVMGTNPSEFKGPTLPVEQVSWDDAQLFIRRLNAMTGGGYRLPTEAEWEYAARAGTTTEYPFDAYFDQASDYAWILSVSQARTHPVGEKLPNEFGLYDTLGNVWEWVQDCSSENYERAPSDGSAAPETDGCRRGLRGGSWNNTSLVLRSGSRVSLAPGTQIATLGFRLAKTLP
jgi:formylglycine-generating enzyme required for sulfatase activity